jgi:hypothetical protein
MMRAQLDAVPARTLPARLLVHTQYAAVESGDFRRSVESLQMDWLTLIQAPSIERLPDSSSYLQKGTPGRGRAGGTGLAATSRAVRSAVERITGPPQSPFRSHCSRALCASSKCILQPTPRSLQPSDRIPPRHLR